MKTAQWVAPTDVQEVSDTAQGLFRNAFGGVADGVWAAPGRVNLIGEHVDYASGLVLPFALPYVTVVAVRARDDGILHAVTTHTGEAWRGGLAEVGSGCPTGWSAYVAGVAWALRRSGHLPARLGFDVAVHSTIPSGSGLSSSAALECAFALAVAEIAGLPTDDAGREPLIAASILAENEFVGAPTGGMDQTVAMLARRGHALLLDCRDGAIRQVPLDFHAAEAQLMVIDTNARHRLVDGQYGNRRSAIEKACSDLRVATLRDVPDADPGAVVAALDPLVAKRARHVLAEIGRVREVSDLLDRGRITDIGDALNRSHASLRDDYEVSSAELDCAVDAALEAGAWGARMTGGGFGGSVIALVPTARIDAVVENIVGRAISASFAVPQFLAAEPSGPARRL